MTVSVTETGDEDVVTISPASVTFTTTNWNTDQDVDVTGSSVDSNTSTTVNFAGSGGGFGAIDVDKSISVVNVGLVFSASPTEVLEGNDITFSFKLANQPLSDVVVSVTEDSGDTDAVTISPASVTFTTSNWNTDQDVVVTGSAVDSNTSTVVNFASDAGNIDEDKSVTVNDTGSYTLYLDDEAAWSLVLVGTPNSTTWHMDEDLPENVTVTWSRLSGDTTIAVAPTTAVTVTPSGALTDRTVTLTSTANTVAVAVIRATVAAVDSNSDYEGATYDFSVSSYNGTVSGVQVLPKTITVTEGTSTLHGFYYDRSPEPGNTVRFTDTSVVAKLSWSPNPYHKDSAGFAEPQSITVAVAEDVDTEDETVIAHFAVEDSFGNVVGRGTHTYTILDDDEAVARSPSTPEPETPKLPPGFILVNFPETVTIGAVSNFTLALEEEPTEDVTVTLVSSDPSEVYLAKTSYTFTSGSWNTPAAGGLLGLSLIHISEPTRPY